MSLKSITVGVVSERPKSQHVSSILVRWTMAAPEGQKSISLTRDEAIETCARILAMISLLAPMDTADIDAMVRRVDSGEGA